MTVKELREALVDFEDDALIGCFDSVGNEVEASKIQLHESLIEGSTTIYLVVT